MRYASIVSVYSLVQLSFFCLLPVFSEKPPTPPPPPPVVYFRDTDDTLRNIVKRLRDRKGELKLKSIDPYATSPEITPPVSKYEPTCRQETNKVKGLFNSSSLVFVQRLF